MHKQFTQFSAFESSEQALNDRARSLLRKTSLSYLGPDNSTSVSSMTLESNIGYNPRSAIFSLTLKLIVDHHTQPLVKYSFGMLRGLYKEFLRSKTPTRPRPPRRSYRTSSQLSSENTEINEFGEILSQHQQKKNFFSSQSRPESPCYLRKSWESSKSSTRLDFNYKQFLRSLLKIPARFLAKHFLKFKENLIGKNSKKTGLKNFVNKISALSFRLAFNKLLRVNWTKAVFQDSVTRSRAGELNMSQTKNESFGRSASFEQKDKELWRKRHPIRRVSPSPAASRHSLLTDLGDRDTGLLRSSGFGAEGRTGVRRNTERALKSFESFGNVELSNEDHHDEGKSPPKVSKMKKKNQEKFRSGKPEDSNYKDKLEKMVNSLDKHRKGVIARGFLRINSAVEEEKKLEKKNAGGLIADLLNFRVKRTRAALTRFAFDRIKNEAKERSVKLDLKRELKKPPKKPILRSGNQSQVKKQNIEDKGKKMVKLLEFSKTRAFKNKLLAFLAITQNSGPKPKNLNSFNRGLRTVFRVLEAKKFSKVCRTFHYIKRYSSNRVNALQRKYIVFSQKLSRIMDYSVKSRTQPAFSALVSAFSRPRAGRKLKSVLESILQRVKFIVNPMVWYKLNTFSKEIQFNSKLRPVKMQFIIRKFYIRRLAFAFV